MSNNSDSPLDRLWREYSQPFRDFDDLTLARWLAQTLGQISGHVWRLSHPLLGAYRLGSRLAHERQIWLKRLVAPPATYVESGCCRAPLLPLLTRDVLDSGLICQHCEESCVTWEEMPESLHGGLRDWAQRYAPVHEVAHWDDDRRRRAGNYDGQFEDAALHCEGLLAEAGRVLSPKFLEFYPAIIWEDQDECLEVRPEDIEL